MKILHTVEFYLPSQGGMQEVVKQLSERLARQGHEVTVATTKLPQRASAEIDGVAIEEFAVAGNQVRGFTGEAERYQNFLRESRFDIVANFAAQQWATDLALPILNQIHGKKVLIPTGFSGLYALEYVAYFEAMKTGMTQYDVNVFLSDDYRDINFARANGINNRVLIPNGAAADEFLAAPALDIRRRLGIPKRHRLILLVGSHTNLKGHAEAIQIFEQAQIENTTFLLVANRIGPGCRRNCYKRWAQFSLSPANWRTGKRLQIRSLSRPETVAAYQSADLFLFPSNIECSPLVLFECMASRTPFLTTDVGNAAEIIAWSGGGRMLPTQIDAQGLSHADITGSVKMVEHAAADVSGQAAQAAAGHAAWQQRFTWERIAEDYERLYCRLTKE